MKRKEEKKKKKKKKRKGMEYYGFVGIAMIWYTIVWNSMDLYGFLDFCMDLFHF